MIETLRETVTIENGMWLLVFNMEFPGDGLLDELELARSQGEALLQLIPAD